MSALLLLPLRAGEGWEGVHPNRSASPHDGLYPSPTLPCCTQAREKAGPHEGCLPA
jgi:hypothetical protein